MHPVLLMSGTRLAQLIRTGELSSTQIVDAHVRHVQRVNPTLNAVVCDRFDRARIEARAADERVRAEQGARARLPAFLGVPCTIKEAFAFDGMPNTSGLVARAGHLASSDATGVHRLRMAGVVPLGVTNVSELCMWMESDNRVYGRTNNPYDRRRIVGGSSGGEGAIIGAGGSPFGLGSDIGGSIRLPAFFNGVFGHKPTGGLVPGSGQFPFAHGAARRYLTTGPLARRAEDLMPLLRLLAGPDGIDDGCEARTLGDPAAVNLRGLDVIVIQDNGAVAVSRELKRAQQRCADELANAGASVSRDRIDLLRSSLEIWSSMMSTAGGPSFGEMLGEGVEIDAWRELAKCLLGRSSHTLPAIGLALFEKVPRLLTSRTKRGVELGLRLREQLLRCIGPHGVLLYPPYSEPAPRHGAPLLSLFDWVYTAIFNVMELPVTHVPVGLNRLGLPLGIQVASVHGHDHLTIAVAMALESCLGGWVPPWRRAKEPRIG